MNDIKAKAEQAIRQQVAILERRPDLIEAIGKLTAAEDIKAEFNSLTPDVAEAVLMVSLSTLMNCQTVEAIKRQDQSGLN